MRGVHHRQCFAPNITSTLTNNINTDTNIVTTGNRLLFIFSLILKFVLVALGWLTYQHTLTSVITLILQVHYKKQE